MKFANIDKNGLVTGFYDNEIHQNIPDGCIEISFEKWEELLEKPNQKYYRKKWKDYDPYDEITDDVKWVSLKNSRNNEIQKSDWTQFNDSPLSPEKQELWKVWRQNLRDIPSNFPKLTDAQAELTRLVANKP